MEILISVMAVLLTLFKVAYEKVEFGLPQMWFYACFNSSKTPVSLQYPVSVIDSFEAFYRLGCSAM
jgi:hypothetical protein